MGLDGATWSLLSRLERDFRIPTIKRLKSRGAWGRLRSTDPAITGAAWLAIATGLNPGKTGVIDFFRRDRADSLSLRPVSAVDYRGKAFWDLASIEELRYGVMFYPMLYPPYPLQGGFIVSGGIGVPSDEVLSQPPEVRDQLLGLLPSGFRLVVEPRSRIYSDLGRFIEDCAIHIKGLGRISRWLAARLGDIDGLTYVVSVTDWIQHRAWHVIADHPLSNKLGEREYRGRVEELYTMLDEEVIYPVVEAAEAEEKLIMMVSDHGFQAHYGVFGLARVLYKHGLLHVHTVRLLRYRLLSMVKGFLRRIGVAEKLRRRVPGGVRKIARTRLEDVIDYSKSDVYLLAHSNLFGAIYFKRKDGELEEAVRRAIIEEAEKHGIKVEVRRREELYSGPLLELLPDLIVIANEYATLVANTFNYPIYKQGVLDKQYTGAHHRDGILLIYGPGVKKAEGINASIYSVAPTVLYAHGLPIPDDVDEPPLKTLIDLGEPRYVKRIAYRIRKLRRTRHR